MVSVSFEEDAFVFFARCLPFPFEGGFVDSRLSTAAAVEVADVGVIGSCGGVDMAGV